MSGEAVSLRRWTTNVGGHNVAHRGHPRAHPCTGTARVARPAPLGATVPHRSFPMGLMRRAASVATWDRQWHVPCVAKGAGRKEGPDGSDRAPVGRGVRYCPQRSSFGFSERAGMSSVSAYATRPFRERFALGGGGGAPSRPGFVRPASQAKCFPQPQLARCVVAVARVLRGFEPDHRVRPELAPRPGAHRA